VERQRKKAQDPDLTTLVKEIVHDSETLIGQQLQLLRSEVTEELDQAKEAALAIGAGAGLVATGGVLSALMVVHALHKATRLPLWSCYGLVGGLLGAAGAGLLAAGRTEALGVRLLPPPQTTEALKENLSWLKDQTTTEAT
jgi:uncharacterized membrane protein YedE/YeeE